MHGHMPVVTFYEVAKTATERVYHQSIKDAVDEYLELVMDEDCRIDPLSIRVYESADVTAELDAFVERTLDFVYEMVMDEHGSDEPVADTQPHPREHREAFEEAMRAYLEEFTSFQVKRCPEKDMAISLAHYKLEQRCRFFESYREFVCAAEDIYDAFGRSGCALWLPEAPAVPFFADPPSSQALPVAWPSRAIPGMTAGGWADLSALAKLTELLSQSSVVGAPPFPTPELAAVLQATGFKQRIPGQIDGYWFVGYKDEDIDLSPAGDPTYSLLPELGGEGKDAFRALALYYLDTTFRPETPYEVRKEGTGVFLLKTPEGPVLYDVTDPADPSSKVGTRKIWAAGGGCNLEWAQIAAKYGDLAAERAHGQPAHEVLLRRREARAKEGLWSFRSVSELEVALRTPSHHFRVFGADACFFLTESFGITRSATPPARGLAGIVVAWWENGSVTAGWVPEDDLQDARAALMRKDTTVVWWDKPPRPETEGILSHWQTFEEQMRRAREVDVFNDLGFVVIGSRLEETNRGYKNETRDATEAEVLTFQRMEATTPELPVFYLHTEEYVDQNKFVTEDLFQCLQRPCFWLRGLKNEALFSTGDEPPWETFQWSCQYRAFRHGWGSK